MMVTDLPVVYQDRKLEKKVWDVLDYIEGELLRGKPSGFYEGLTYRVVQSAIGKAVLLEEDNDG
jgi:hypothetical protein